MNILIVDDDVLIRNWLTMLLNQIQKYDIKIFEAKDGESALDVLKANDIDLAFSDIKMPGMSGLELESIIKTRYPETKTVILSAYDDFDYVRQALQHGALDYILKPEMKISDIENILNKLAVFSEDKKSNPDEFKRVLQNNEALTMYMSGEMTTELFLDSIGYNNAKKCFSCIGINFIKPLSDGDQSKACEIITKVFKSENIDAICFSISASRLLIAFGLDLFVPETIKNDLNRLFLIVKNSIEEYFGDIIAYSISNSMGSNTEIKKLLTESISSLMIQQYYEEKSSEQKSNKQIAFNAKKTLKEVAGYIDARCSDQAIKCFISLINDAHGLRLNPTELKSIVINGIMLFFTYTDTEAYGSLNGDKLNKFINNINAVETQREMDNLIDKFIDYYKKCIENSNVHISSQIKKAMNYINEHYMEKITLDGVAAVVYMNPSYLSQQFKKQVNISFSDYLENIRISNAKILLRHSNKPISEISELVGFSSQNYFTTVFKCTVGVSPNKYKALAFEE